MNDLMFEDKILGHTVVFEPIEHKYFVDGKEVPSISQICKKAFPDLYKGIDENILRNAAKKGTDLHEEIELYEKHGVQGMTPEFNHYIDIKRHLGFKKQLSEKMVIIKIDGEVICAGRFDLLATMNDKNVLIDFKRTYQLKINYVKLQLNLYRLGLMHSYGIKIDEIYVIRLRYSEREVVRLMIDEENTVEMLKRLAI